MKGIGTHRRGFLEAGLRLAGLLAWSGWIAFTWILRAPFVRRDARAAAAAHFASRWSRGALRLLGIRVDIHGTPPSTPFFLVSNHLGYLDIALLAAQVPCTFVSKAEVSAWPVFGTLANLAGTLYVDRQSRRDAGRVSRLIPDHFGSGGSLVLFPEGTSTSGENLAPFRSPMLEFAAAADYPVHYAAIRYHAPRGFAPAGLTMAWWGDARFLPHFLGLFRMPGMRAEIAFGPEPLQASDRKRLASLLQDAVDERLRWLRGDRRGHSLPAALEAMA